jgi:predicted dehydrogenase
VSSVPLAIAPPVRLGLVGCGRLAEVGYAPAARAAAGVEIVAVSDPDRARRGRVAGRLGASAHARVSELLAAGDLEGIVICTPPEHHEEVAAEVAAAGHVALVETPPAHAHDSALRLMALEPVPWMGFRRRFDHGLELAGRVPPTGELELRMQLHDRVRSWRPDPLLDLAPHLIDLALHLTTALPLAVRAHAARNRVGIELATSRARVRIECTTERAAHELVEILDAGGRRIARAERGGRARGAAARVLPGAHPLVRSLSAQLEAFGRALRGGDPGPLATAGEGAAVMCVLDAARRSDAIGGETTAVEGVTFAT